jgi:methyl-accepting chemotaxis protein
MNRLDN